MARIDDLFHDLGDVWIWTPPHPRDARPAPRRRVQTRIGTRVGDDLEPRLGLTGRKDRFAAGMLVEVVDLTGRSDHELGAGRLRRPEGPLAPVTGSLRVEDVGDAFVTSDGGIRLPGRVEDHNEIITRGSPPVDEEMDLRELGGRALRLGRGLLGTGRREALRRNREELAEREALLRAGRIAGTQLRTHVEAPLVAFDGWLTATQHLDEDGERTVESWQVAVDLDRDAPGSIGLALAACALMLQLRWQGLLEGTSIDDIIGL